MSDRKRRPFMERFMEKVQILDSGCWEWTANRAEQGYGRIRYWGAYRNAHRLYYGLTVGPVPDGLMLDHYLYPGACIGPSCVNPDHLRPVTHEENMARGAWARRTHCPQGHPYDEANTYLCRRKNGKTSRQCRACHRLRDARRTGQMEASNG